MTSQAPSISEAAEQLEASAGRLRRRLADMTETKSAMANDTIEAALKEISNQLRSNEDHLKHLRDEIQCIKTDVEDSWIKIAAVYVPELVEMEMILTKPN